MVGVIGIERGTGEATELAGGGLEGVRKERGRIRDEFSSSLCRCRIGGARMMDGIVGRRETLSTGVEISFLEVAEHDSSAYRRRKRITRAIIESRKTARAYLLRFFRSLLCCVNL